MADCATHARLGHITALKNGLAFFDFLHFFIIVLCLWKKVFLGGIQSHVICISTDWSVLYVSEVARVRRNKFCSHMMSTKWKKINLHKNHCLVAALPAPLPPQPPSIIWLKLQQYVSYMNERLVTGVRGSTNGTQRAIKQSIYEAEVNESQFHFYMCRCSNCEVSRVCVLSSGCMRLWKLNFIQHYIDSRSTVRKYRVEWCTAKKQFFLFCFQLTNF